MEVMNNMDLFSFFKKNKEQKINTSDNEFLDIEASMYDTEDNSPKFEDNVNYKNLIYNPSSNNVSKYKAVRNDIGVVIDKDQFGYNINDFNSNIKTYELEKNSDEEKLQIDSKEDYVQQNNYSSIEEVDNTIDILSEENDNIMSQKEVEKIEHNEQIKVSENEFSIFGSVDNIIKEIKHDPINSNEAPSELIKNVKFTKEGYKICPNCGTILNPEAPVCFMCSNSFIKK